MIDIFTSKDDSSISIEFHYRYSTSIIRKFTRDITIKELRGVLEEFENFMEDQIYWKESNEES